MSQNSILLNKIEAASKRLRLISRFWCLRDDCKDSTSVRIYGVVMGPDDVPFVTYSPDIDAISDPIYTQPLDDFLIEFQPYIKTPRLTG